jgi:hypothetical protein
MSEPAWIIRVIWRRLGLSDNSILEAPPCLLKIHFIAGDGVQAAEEFFSRAILHREAKYFAVSDQLRPIICFA